MRKSITAGAAALCLVLGSLTATAGSQVATLPQPLQRTSGVIAPGGDQVFETSLQVNDHLTVWVANTAAAGGPSLRLRLQRWGFSSEPGGAFAVVDVGSISVPAGGSARFDQVATATGPYQVIVDAPGATADAPYAIDPVTTPGTGLASEHSGTSHGAVAHIIATPPLGRDVRYLSEPAAGLHRWRVDLAPGDALAVQVDHLSFDRPSSVVSACLQGPGGGELAAVDVGGAGSGVLRYTAPGQGHYVIDLGCRPGSATSGMRPYFTPRPGRVPGSPSYIGANRLVPKAGTQNGGALDRYWRMDLEAGDVLDLWYASVDPETSSGTLCIDGPQPGGGLVQVAAKHVPHGQASQVVLVAPWTGRYVVNGACLPGNGLFEMYIN